jgi:hypothetical protein
MAPSWMSFQVSSNSDDQVVSPSCSSCWDSELDLHPSSEHDICLPSTTTSNEFTELLKSTRKSLYIIMTALWLLPANKP